MILSLPYKTKQFFVVLIKLSIVVGAFYFIYHKLASNKDLELHDFIDFLHENNVFSLKNVFFLYILTVFNWFFEILKWKQLVSSVAPISFKNASEQSLGALTASLLTPNRIGEYGAKAIYYPKPLRKKIMLLNLISNMMQMSTTIALGIIGLLYFVNYYPLQLDYFKLSILLSAMVLFFFLAVYSMKHHRFQIKGFSLKKILTFIIEISIDIKIKAVVLSVVRYLIFSFQFYLLLQIFKVNIDYFDAMMVITSMYFLSSIVPSIFIFDVVIKGSFAVYLFSMVGVNDLTVLSTVTLMWLMNFVVPSVFGSYYVLNFNLPTTEEYL